MKGLFEHLESKSHVIWDWNGTLLDDVDLCVETISHVLSDNGLPAITRERYLEQFGFPVIEYYKKIGFDLKKTDFMTVSNQFVQRYRARVQECALHKGAVEFLHFLREQGKVQSVLSAAHEADLKHQLKHFNILHLFEEVYGIADHYAASKIDRGRELLKQLAVSPEKAVLIGDTDHDLEVANALGIDLLLMGNGHQHPDRLNKLGVKVLTTRH